jgi:dihydroorotase
MPKKILKNATIVSGSGRIESDLLIEDQFITKIDRDISITNAEVHDLKGAFLIPGCIDNQVHFREPGLTHKGTIESGSRAALAGGITTFMEQPNTQPNTTTFEALEDKFQRAAKSAYVNYSFFFGGTNDNLELIKRLPIDACAGIKLFLGSSTGNMLIDREETIRGIFSNTQMIIAAHCEDESIIRANTANAIEQFGEDIPMEQHPIIRSHEACYASSSRAIELARETGARLHVFHLSTAQEMELFDRHLPFSDKQITAEVCLHHLWFTDADYAEKGSLIKWNPAVKGADDRKALWEGLRNNTLDILATDHAPHTLEEKQNKYLQSPSGGPLEQHALMAYLDKVEEGEMDLELLVQKFCHNPAELYKIDRRGRIQEGYYADLVTFSKRPYSVVKDNLLYLCQWSPFEGHTFSHSIDKVWVNGHLGYAEGQISHERHAMKLRFNR